MVPIRRVTAPKLVVWSAGSTSFEALETLDCREVIVATRDTVEAAVADADILLVDDFAASDPEAVWRAAGAARWIHFRGTGVDHLLTPSLTGHAAVLTNGRGCLDRPIAEFVLMQVLALAKGLPDAVRAQSAGCWDPRLGDRIDGARALVVGPGSIGSRIAALLSAVGVLVDGAGSRERPGGNGFGRIRSTGCLASYVGEYDYVIIAAALTATTHRLVDGVILQRMKPSARLINVARGAIVDEAALAAALTDGRIAGAALDVFETEPLPTSSALWGMSNVLVTPHLAGDVAGWRECQYDLFVRNFERFVTGQRLQNVVDKERGYVPDGSGKDATKGMGAR